MHVLPDSVTNPEGLRTEGQNEATEPETGEEVGRCHAGSAHGQQGHESRLQSQPQNSKKGRGKGKTLLYNKCTRAQRVVLVWLSSHLL